MDSRFSDILITENSYEQEIFDEYKRFIGREDFNDGDGDGQYSESEDPLDSIEHISPSESPPGSPGGSSTVDSVSRKIKKYLNRIDLFTRPDNFERQVKTRLNM